MSKRYRRRYIVKYNPTGGFGGEPTWEVKDNQRGDIIEGGYTQEAARKAAHFHNYQHDPEGYTKRNLKTPIAKDE